MSNPILAKRSEEIFNDKFSDLPMKEIGIELKHYRVGTAPENPSFVANQDNAKKQLVEKFKQFFGDGMGLELPILVSNIGDGKTHFIRMIFDAFKDIATVKTKRVYLRDEQVDIKIKIIEAMDRVEIKKCVEFIISEVQTSYKINDDEIITCIQEKYNVNSNLANIIAKANSKDLITQIKAIQVLKGKIDEPFFKELGIYDFSDSSEEFYFGFLMLLCKYLDHSGIYIIVVFDELEHVLDWRDKGKQKRFFRNIKEFTDNITLYPNLFLMFAATQIVKGREIIGEINSVEPASYDRMKSLFIQLDDINSDEELKVLIENIKIRYEKFYSVKFNNEVVIKTLKQRIGSKNIETSYRNYSQEIMKVFDSLRQNETELDYDKDDESEKMKVAINEIKVYSRKKWENAASPMANKSMLINAIRKLITLNNYKVFEANTDRKMGYFTFDINSLRILYYIVYTSRVDDKALFLNKLNLAVNATKQTNSNKLVFFYPEKLINGDISDITSKYENTKFIKYNEDNVMELVALLNSELNSKYVDYIVKSNDFMVVK